MDVNVFPRNLDGQIDPCMVMHAIMAMGLKEDMKKR